MASDQHSENAQPEEATPASLLDGIRKHDPVAWRRLIELWTPIIYARCRRNGLTAEDAEDITQSALLRIYSGISRFRRDGVSAKFRFWVATITRNLLNSYWSQQKQRPAAMGGSDARHSMENYSDNSENKDREDTSWCEPLQVMAQALRLIERDVSPRSWNAFQLVQYQQLTHREAAEQLGMTEGAVRVANHRIRERLKAELLGMLD